LGQEYEVDVGAEGIPGLASTQSNPSRPLNPPVHVELLPHTALFAFGPEVT
jgi:hypothetical protein